MSDTINTIDNNSSYTEDLSPSLEVLLSETVEKPKSKVKFNEFDPSCFQCGNPVTKKAKNDPDVQFHVCELTYNYGTEDLPISMDFNLEGPEVTCYGGIITSLPNDKIKYAQNQIKLTLRPSEESDRLFMEALDNLYFSGVHYLEQYRIKGYPVAKLTHFDKDKPRGHFSHPLYVPIDPVTKEPQVGRSGTLYVKVNDSTLFTDSDGNPIPHSALKNAELRLIPLVHWYRIFIGVSGMKFQFSLKSAIVTDYKEANSTTLQVDTIKYLQKEKPDLGNFVRSQLAAVEAKRAELVLSKVGGNIPIEKEDTPHNHTALLALEAPPSAPDIPASVSKPLHKPGKPQIAVPPPKPISRVPK